MSNIPDDGAPNGADFLAFLMGRGAQCEHAVKLQQALLVLGAAVNRVPGGRIMLSRDELLKVGGCRIQIEELPDGGVAIDLSASPEEKQPTHAAPSTRQ